MIELELKFNIGAWADVAFAPLADLRAHDRWLPGAASAHSTSEKRLGKDGECGQLAVQPRCLRVFVHPIRWPFEQTPTVNRKSLDEESIGFYRGCRQ